MIKVEDEEWRRRVKLLLSLGCATLKWRAKESECKESRRGRRESSHKPAVMLASPQSIVQLADRGSMKIVGSACSNSPGEMKPQSLSAKEDFTEHIQIRLLKIRAEHATDWVSPLDSSTAALLVQIQGCARPSSNPPQKRISNFVHCLVPAESWILRLRLCASLGRVRGVLS